MKSNSSRFLIAHCFTCLLLNTVATGSALAQASAPLPKAELGIGLSMFQFPAYRGSNQSSTLALPIPYFDYRGDVLKADREGIRASFFESDRLELTLSLSGSPPIKSTGITLRQGMADVKPSIELGPQINALLSSPDNKAMRLRLRLPLRQGFSIESSPRDVGLSFSPNLNLDFPNPWGQSGANLGFVVGPIFTNKRQNDYFYTVSAADATLARPAYQAGGGYAGSQFLVSWSQKFNTLWVGSYLRYDNLSGAAFAASPLVATRHYLTAGVAVSAIFAKF